VYLGGMLVDRQSMLRFDPFLLLRLHGDGFGFLREEPYLFGSPLLASAPLVQFFCSFPIHGPLVTFFVGAGADLYPLFSLGECRIELKDSFYCCPCQPLLSPSLDYNWCFFLPAHFGRGGSVCRIKSEYPLFTLTLSVSSNDISAFLLHVLLTPFSFQRSCFCWRNSFDSPLVS